MSVTVPPPDSVDMGTCKRCGALIRFVFLVNGKRIPVEPEAGDSGRLRAEYSVQDGCYLRGRFLLPGELASAPRFNPHSDNCGRRAGGRGAPIPADLKQQMMADIAAARARYEAEINGLA